MARNAVVNIIIRGRDMTKVAFAGVRGRLAGLKTAAMGVQGALAGLGIALGGASIIRALVNTNRQYEKLQAQLHTVQGSAEAGKAAFLGIEKLAASTPFQIEQLTEAFILLRALGTSPMEEDMLRLGDLASSFNRDITDVAAAIRSAAAGMTLPLKQMGFDAVIVGDMITLTFDGIEKTVKRDAQSIMDAVTSISAERFGGAMEREMKTLDGAISNLMDNIGTLFRAIGDAGLTGGLTSVAVKFRDLAGDIAANREAITYWTTIVLGALKAVGRTVWGVFKLAFDAGNLIGEALKTAMSGWVLGIMTVVNGAIKGINWLIEQANRIPGIDLDFKINEFDTTEWQARATSGFADMSTEANQMFQTLIGIGEAWLTIGQNAKVAAANTRRALASGPTANLLAPGAGGGVAGGGVVGQDPSQFTRIRAELAAMQADADARMEAMQAAFQQTKDAAMELGRTVDDVITGSVVRLGDAFTSAFEKAASGAISLGQALEQAMIGAVATTARAFGEFFIAQAIAALGMGIFLGPFGMAKGIAAAAKLGAAATAMFALSGALSAAGGGGGGAGGGAGVGTRAAEGAREGGGTIIIKGGVLDMTNFDQAEQLKRAIEELGGLRDLNLVVEP